MASGRVSWVAIRSNTVSRETIHNSNPNADARRLRTRGGVRGQIDAFPQTDWDVRASSWEQVSLTHADKAR